MILIIIFGFIVIIGYLIFNLRRALNKHSAEFDIFLKERYAESEKLAKEIPVYGDSDYDIKMKLYNKNIIKKRSSYVFYC